MNPVVNMPEPLLLGLHALYFIALEPQRHHSADELSARCGGSKTHMQKVLGKLASAGFLTVKKGPGGGFALSQQGGSLRLIWVFELLGGPFRPAGCGLEHEECCPIGTLLDELILSIRGFLASKTLDDLVNYHRRWPRVHLELVAEEDSMGREDS